jgi:hypothetical protein
MLLIKDVHPEKASGMLGYSSIPWTLTLYPGLGTQLEQ